MSKRELSKQLIENLFGNLGLQSVGVGLTDDRNILDKKLKLEEEDSSISEYQVWGGECLTGEIPIKAVASNIGTKEKPDFVLAIIQGELILAMRYSWENSDHGIFLTLYEKKWVDMEVLHKLNLTAAIEMVTQNGLPWTRSNEQEKLYKILTEVLSTDD